MRGATQTQVLSRMSRELRKYPHRLWNSVYSRSGPKCRYHEPIGDRCSPPAVSTVAISLPLAHRVSFSCPKQENDLTLLAEGSYVGGQSFPAWGNSYNQKAKTKGTQPTPPKHKIMWWEAPKPLQIV